MAVTQRVYLDWKGWLGNRSPEVPFTLTLPSSVSKLLLCRIPNNDNNYNVLIHCLKQPSDYKEEDSLTVSLIVSLLS